MSLSLSAADAPGHVLTYSAANLPPGLTINPSTGLVSGTLTGTAAQGSPYAVTVAAVDGNHSANQTFTWAVKPAVTLTAVANQQNAPGDVVSVAVSAADALGKPLTFSAVGLPPGLSIDPATGTMSGTLAVNAARGLPSTVTVSAGAGTSTASTSFTWAVAPRRGSVSRTRPDEFERRRGVAERQRHGHAGQGADLQRGGLPAGLASTPRPALFPGRWPL